MTARLEAALAELAAAIREEVATAAAARLAATRSGPKLYTVPIAAELCGLSRAQLYKAIRAGTIASKKIMGRRLISEASLTAFIEGTDDGPAVSFTPGPRAPEGSIRARDRVPGGAMADPMAQRGRHGRSRSPS